MEQTKTRIEVPFVKMLFFCFNHLNPSRGNVLFSTAWELSIFRQSTVCKKTFRFAGFMQHRMRMHDPDLQNIPLSLKMRKRITKTTGSNKEVMVSGSCTWISYAFLLLSHMSHGFSEKKKETGSYMKSQQVHRGVYRFSCVNESWFIGRHSCWDAKNAYL